MTLAALTVQEWGGIIVLVGGQVVMIVMQILTKIENMRIARELRHKKYQDEENEKKAKEDRKEIKKKTVEIESQLQHNASELERKLAHNTMLTKQNIEQLNTLVGKFDVPTSKHSVVHKTMEPPEETSTDGDKTRVLPKDS
jgi:uncharacterized protein YlxW (UPF0749 family)